MRKRIYLDASAIIFNIMQIYNFKSVLSECLSAFFPARLSLSIHD